MWRVILLTLLLAGCELSNNADNDQNVRSVVLVKESCPSEPPPLPDSVRGAMIMETLVLSVAVKLGVQFVTNVTGELLKQYEKGLKGKFVASTTITEGLEQMGCLIIAHGLLEPEENGNYFSKEENGNYYLENHSDFYLEMRIEQKNNSFSLEPISLNYAAAIAKYEGNKKKDISVFLVMSDPNSTRKNGNAVGDIHFTLFHNFGTLEIGKNYNGAKLHEMEMARKMELALLQMKVDEERNLNSDQLGLADNNISYLEASSLAQERLEFSSTNIENVEPLNIYALVIETGELGVVLKSLSHLILNNKKEIQMIFDKVFKALLGVGN
jgi:hypothetical protein